MVWLVSVLNTLDVVLTVVAGRAGATELNPILGGLTDPAGPDPLTLAFKLSLPVLATFGLGALRSRTRWAGWALHGLAWLLGLVVLYHLLNLASLLG